MIFTSYYDKLHWFRGVFHSGEWRERQLLKQKHIELLQISRTAPPTYHGRYCSQLMPSAELLRDFKSGLITTREYIDIFKSQLELQSAERAAKALNGKILLCWEHSDNFCHRHIVASWLRSYGYDCFELESVLRDIKEYM